MADEARIFCSYSRKDAEFMLRLATDLRAAGQPLWLDQLDIAAGDRWDQSVEKALKGANRMLIVLSPASIASNNVMDEVSFALEQGKQVIPVLHQSCEIPFRLRRVQHLDFTRDYDTGLQRLLQHLSGSRADITARSASDSGTEAKGRESSSPKTQRSVMTWIILAAVALGVGAFAARDFLPKFSESSEEVTEPPKAEPPTPTSGDEVPPEVNETPEAEPPSPTPEVQAPAAGPTCNPSAKPFQVELFTVGSDCHVVPDLSGLTPASTSRQWTIDLARSAENNPVVWGFQTGNNWSAKIDSHLEVRRPGAYTFDVTIAYADAAWLIVDGRNIIRTGCTEKTEKKKSETINLDAGIHKLELLYGDDGWPDALQLQYAGPDTDGVVKLIAPPEAISCED